MGHDDNPRLLTALERSQFIVEERNKSLIDAFIFQVQYFNLIFDLPKS